MSKLQSSPRFDKSSEARTLVCLYFPVLLIFDEFRSPEVLVMPRLRSSPRFGKSSDAKTTRKTAKKYGLFCYNMLRLF